MATSGFHIEIDNTDIISLMGRVENFDADPVLKKLGERLLNRAKIRFQLGIDPEGNSWKPSKKLKKTRGVADPKRRGQTLIGKTRRLSSIRYSLQGDSLEVGPPPLPYAAIHQFGGKPGMAPGPAGIPARPYMQTDLDESDVEFLRRAIVKAIMG